jgi:hypothetical protein
VRHPSPGVPGMPHTAMAERAVALADELALRDRVVFFNFGWVPYAERGHFLLEADIAVSAHFDDIETRFAFRTRLLDCLWAGLPVVTTRGDTLGDLVVAGGAGHAVDFGDVQGWVDALEALLDDAPALQLARDAASRLRSSFEWQRVLQPLHHLADPATSVPATHKLERTAAAEYLSLRLRIGYEQHGLRGTARRLLLRLGAAARRQRTDAWLP